MRHEEDIGVGGGRDMGGREDRCRGVVMRPRGMESPVPSDVSLADRDPTAPCRGRPGPSRAPGGRTPTHTGVVAQGCNARSAFPARSPEERRVHAPNPQLPLAPSLPPSRSLPLPSPPYLRWRRGS